MRVRSVSLAMLLLLATSAAAEPIELRALTYNIHGLPSWIAGDDPPARIPQLLAKARDYDVVLLQEDFAHQPIVDTHRDHPHRWRGNGAQLPILGQGAGLTILSRHPSSREPIATPYGVCNGWVSAANDCFGNKGYLHVRLALPDGSELDVWNTHLDAGPGDADRAARARQLAMLADAIESQSGGRPLLVGGDFNLEWSHAADRALLEEFARRLDLTIAAQTAAGDWDSQLDYLLVRAAPERCIEAREPGKDESFRDTAERPLSDHPAIGARLQIAGC